MRCKGFTLIELLVVISIIAILVALATGAMIRGSRKAAGDVKCLAELRGASTYISSWMDDDIHRDFPVGHYEDGTPVPMATSTVYPCRVTEWELAPDIWRCPRNRDGDRNRWSDRIYIAQGYMWNFRTATWDPPLAARVYALAPDSPILEDAGYWHDGRGAWVSYAGYAGFYYPDE